MPVPSLCGVVSFLSSQDLIEFEDLFKILDAEVKTEQSRCQIQNNEENSMIDNAKLCIIKV
jgi:hypothetical protein